MTLAGLMMGRPLLVAPLLRYAADYHGDTTIVTRSVEGPLHRTNYADTHARVQKLAHALIALGIKPGDRVATLAWNTWRHLELYYAVAGIGAVCHTVNPRLPVVQMAYVLSHAGSRVLFFDTTFLPLAVGLKAAVPTLEKVVALCDAANLPAEAKGMLTYEELIAPQPETYEWPEFNENTAASLCYTSGTTGIPKGVLYSHRALVLHSYGMISAVRMNVEDIVLPVVPMFHVNAWGIPYAAPLMGAAQVYAGRAMDGPSLFSLMDEEGVTCALGVPTIWMGLLAHMKTMGRKPKALRRVVIGGAAVPEAMVRAFELDFDVDVHHGWGMTETTPMGVINTLKPKYKSLPRAAQIDIKMKQGRAIFGVDMRIVDEKGAVLPHDGVSAGLLQVRGPWVIKSYFKEEASPLTEDGWFSTADIATLDGDGYLHITDRAKDIIKSGGEWISSLDLENAAMGHPDIALAAVIGAEHPRWLERPLLICVPKGDVRPTLEQIHAYLIQKVPKWWLPDAVEYVASLPIGPTGKVQKTTLREQYRAYKFAS